LVLSVIGWGLSDIGHKGKDEILKMKKKINLQITLNHNGTNPKLKQNQIFIEIIEAFFRPY
tara:strand:- start:4671 stop:4853 length:183 start_codon:yes stop_codon:yes gene_type:complete